MDWSMLEDWLSGTFDAYYPYCDENNVQPVPAQDDPTQAQPYPANQAFTLLLPPSNPVQPPPPPNPVQPPPPPYAVQPAPPPNPVQPPPPPYVVQPPPPPNAVQPPPPTNPVQPPPTPNLVQPPPPPNPVQPPPPPNLVQPPPPPNAVQPPPAPNPVQPPPPPNAVQPPPAPKPVQPPPPPAVTFKWETPREIRNKAEKQRRDKMNRSIARLAAIVPPVVALRRKVDKTSVLKLSAHFLRSHQYVFGDAINSEQQFKDNSARALLGLLKGFILTTTYKGLVVVVSENVQQYLGYTEMDLIGESIFNFIHEEDHQMLREQLMPKSCYLGPNGELLIPELPDAEQKVADILAKEKRKFIIR